MTDEGRAELQQTIEDLVYLNHVQGEMICVLAILATSPPHAPGLSVRALLNAGWRSELHKVEQEGNVDQLVRSVMFMDGRISGEIAYDRAVLADAVAIVEEAAKSAVLDPEDRTQGEQSRPEGKT
jgi:hypothetical protein